jgi:hypothetical protein
MEIFMKTIKALSLAAITMASVTTLNATASDAVVKVNFDAKNMCLHEGKVYSLGAAKVVNEKEWICINARPTSYYIDRNHDARWIPAKYAEKQKSGVSVK